MIKHQYKLSSVTRSSLGEIKSNFIEQAFERFSYLKYVLQTHKIQPYIRLLLLKEIFSIFSEIQAVHDIKGNFSNSEDLKGIFELIVFVRNVLLHFPIFNTWDEISISPEVAREMMPNNNKNKNSSKIAKYLDNNFGKDDITIEAHYEGQKLLGLGSINLSAIKANSEKTFLKSIISEDNIISLLTNILTFLYTAKKTNP